MCLPNDLNQRIRQIHSADQLTIIRGWEEGFIPAPPDGGSVDHRRSGDKSLTPETRYQTQVLLSNTTCEESVQYPNRQVGDRSVSAYERARRARFRIPQPAGWGSFSINMRGLRARATGCRRRIKDPQPAGWGIPGAVGVVF